MTITSVNSCDSSAGLIEKYINTAYDNVKAVADNLSFLEDLYEFLVQYGLTTNIAVKAPVQVVADTPIVLSGNQTISWTAGSGSYTVGAITGMRALVTAQVDPIQNGIYVVQLGAWIRSLDFDGPLDIVDGSLVFSAQGDAWQVDGPQYMLVPGVDPITFRDIDMFAFEAVATATAKATEAASSAAAALVSENAAYTSALGAADAQVAAQASQLAAQGSASSAEDSAVNAEVLANNASISADAAAQSASLAESVVENDRTFATTAAGIAGTTAGQYFRVPQGVGAARSFLYYLNNSGVALAVAETVGYQAYVTQQEQLDTVSRRTEGLQTQEYSTYPYEMVDGEWKVLHAIDDTGKHLMPGGIKVKSLEVDEEVSFSDLNIRELTPFNINSDSFVGEYASVEIDQNGNALWGTLADGTKKYLNQPLHNRAGLPYGDFYAIGDSITANGVNFFDSTRKYESFNDLSWHVWGMLLSMGRLKFVGASATGGFTSAQILSTHLPNALNSGASFCVVMAGRNDVVQGLNINTVTIPNMKKIFLELRKKGIIPVVCTMSAHGNSVSDPNRTSEHTLNAWFRAYARKYKLPLVDLHKATVNPLTGDWMPGYNQDVSHPTNVGTYYMGKALVAGMQEWTAKVYPVMADEQLPNNTLGKNIFTNPLFLNNDGTNPTDWLIGSAGTASIRDVVAGEDVVGKVWMLQNQTATVTVPVTEGQKLGFGFKVKTDAIGNFSFSCAGASGSGLTNLAGLINWKSVIPDWGYFYYEFVVPTGQTSITFTAVAGAGRVHLAQLGLMKISEV